MQWAKKQKGFTIVELLIVIVVIAILAAITIVAYNGIQNRAKQSAAQSRLTQANKKIMTFYVTNSDRYPNDLQEAGVDNTDNGLQYSVNNTSSPKSYGLTSTNGTFSYYISSTNSKISSGGYPGHGQGGVDPIKNYIANPSFETSDVAGTSSASWISGSGITPITPSIPTDGGFSGTTYRRWNMGGTNTTVAYAFTNPMVDTSTSEILGKTIYYSFYVRSSTASQFAAHIYEYSPGNGSSTSSSTGTLTSTPANTWQRVSVSRTIPSDGSIASVRPALRVTTGTTSAGQNIDVDALMITTGALYPYADGNTANWAWSDATNMSISSGPPL